MASDPTGRLAELIAQVAHLPDEFGHAIHQFGSLGALVIALATAGALVWRKWSTLRQLPGVPQFVGYIRRPVIPKAKSGRISVALAQLESDPEAECERMLADALKELHGIDVIRVPRLLRKRATGSQQDAAAHADERARKLLARTRADVLVWGSVLSRGPSWTIRISLASRGRDTVSRKMSLPTLDLPPLLAKDVTELLSLLLRSRFSQIERELDGCYAVDDLRPQILHVRQILANPAQHWHCGGRAALQFAVGYALTTYGLQSGDRQSLLESLELIRESLKYYTREGPFPLTWAAGQNNIGNALHALGEGEPGTHRLWEAATAHLAALEVRDRNNTPLEWAASKNNLGVVYTAMGERGEGMRWFEKAIGVLQEALQVWTHERVPSDWALASNNLGCALYNLGSCKEDVVALRAALVHFRDALKVWTREKRSVSWARAKNNVGTTLRAISEHESDATALALLSEAAVELKDALLERERTRLPLDWAETQNNLAIVEVHSGELEKSPVGIRNGIARYTQALEERTRKRMPYEWAVTQQNLANAYHVLGTIESSSHALNLAISHYREALEEFTRNSAPYPWAVVTFNFAQVLCRLYEREPRPEHFEQAMAAYERAIEVFDVYRPVGAAASRENMEWLRKQRSMSQNH